MTWPKKRCGSSRGGASQKATAGHQAAKNENAANITITIDDDLIALLVAERDRHLRIRAGVPADLSLVRLPDDALMFPNPPAASEDFSFTALRNPDHATKEFTRRATTLGLRGLRLHYLRGTHKTLLLDEGLPVHVVAARCGHGPVVLFAAMRSYEDNSAAAVIGPCRRAC